MSKYIGIYVIFVKVQLPRDEGAKKGI